jgi:hypothetical protein
LYDEHKVEHKNLMNQLDLNKEKQPVVIA